MKLTELDIKTLENDGRLEKFIKKSDCRNDVFDVVEYIYDRQIKQAKILCVYVRSNGNVYVFKIVGRPF